MLVQILNQAQSKSFIALLQMWDQMKEVYQVYHVHQVYQVHQVRQDQVHHQVQDR